MVEILLFHANINALQWGEIRVKKTKGTKSKVLFQVLHMTHVIFVLVYNLKFCILNTPFNTTF
jgi:uncharacterized membrane protein YagU involved in acid resistance